MQVVIEKKHTVDIVIIIIVVVIEKKHTVDIIIIIIIVVVVCRL